MRLFVSAATLIATACLVATPASAHPEPTPAPSPVPVRTESVLAIDDQGRPRLVVVPAGASTLGVGLASVVVPGLGQALMGEAGPALAFGAGAVGLVGATVGLAVGGQSLNAQLLALYPATLYVPLAVWAGVDAALRANAANELRADYMRRLRLKPESD